MRDRRVLLLRRWFVGAEQPLIDLVAGARGNLDEFHAGDPAILFDPLDHTLAFNARKFIQRKDKGGLLTGA